jgi:hypothetical protein
MTTETVATDTEALVNEAICAWGADADETEQVGQMAHLGTPVIALVAALAPGQVGGGR